MQHGGRQHWQCWKGLMYFLSIFISPLPGFFSGPDTAQLAEFLKAAGAMRDHFRFAHTINMTLGLKHGVDTE